MAKEEKKVDSPSLQEIMKGLKDRILEERKKGNVCYATIEGVMTISLEDFIKQPLEGMLYDMNRDGATIMTFLDDPKWVNDLCLTDVLTYYYNRVKELEKQING